MRTDRRSKSPIVNRKFIMIFHARGTGGKMENTTANSLSVNCITEIDSRVTPSTSEGGNADRETVTIPETQTA